MRIRWRQGWKGEDIGVGEGGEARGEGEAGEGERGGSAQRRLFPPWLLLEESAFDPFSFMLCTLDDLGSLIVSLTHVHF